MDNLTHTLTGIAIGQAGLNRKTRFATLALVIGANLPDVDLVTRFAGSATYLKYHRGLTHSILGVVVLGVALAAILYYAGRRAPATRKASPRLDGAWLLATCLIATASHLLMDLTNAYGVRPFLPFSGRWYAWDIMPIVDPLLLALLTVGLGLPMLFRLVSEEVGAHKPGFQRGALFALSLMVALWGVRAFGHRLVLVQLDSHTYARQNPVRVAAFPRPINPFAWTGVVETDTAFHILPASALDDDVEAEHTEVFYKPDRSPALQAALETRTGRIFSDFVRLLWAEVEETQDGFAVTLRDLRFASPESTHPSFVATIELDKELRVRAESFSFLGRDSR